MYDILVNGKPRRYVMMSSSNEILPPRAAGRYIAEHSLDVKVSPDGVEKTAHKVFIIYFECIAGCGKQWLSYS